MSAIKDVVAAVKRGEKVDASFTDLRSTDLRYTDLRYANLHGADLRSTNLHGANLFNANLRYADLRNANLFYANLHDADLGDADLRNADLRNANLFYANLHGADLGDADLRNADLRNANLHGANLRNADGWGGFRIDGLASGQVTGVPTPDGWALTVGCWRGSPDELRLLIEGDRWPSGADEEERGRRRPGLESMLNLFDAHCVYHAGKLAAVIEKWGE